MFRLFKHYVPHAVLLLGFFDLALLGLAAEIGWVWRAHEIGMAVEPLSQRPLPIATFALLVHMAMIAVGVYGPDSLQSLRFAAARLLVAISLGVILLSVTYFILPGTTLWRSNSLYAMGLSIVFLIGNRIILGGLLGTTAFKRRLMVLGAGKRAQRVQDLSERPDAGFVLVGFVAMNDGPLVVEEAINRDAIKNLAKHVENLNVTEVVLALGERRNALPIND